jgi:hypothetical protein
VSEQLEGPFERVRFVESIFVADGVGEVPALPPVSLTRAGDKWSVIMSTTGLTVALSRQSGKLLRTFVPWVNVRDCTERVPERAPERTEKTKP